MDDASSVCSLFVCPAVGPGRVASLGRVALILLVLTLLAHNTADSMSTFDISFASSFDEGRYKLLELPKELVALVESNVGDNVYVPSCSSNIQWDHLTC